MMLKYMAIKVGNCVAVKLGSDETALRIARGTLSVKQHGTPAWIDSGCKIVKFSRAESVVDGSLGTSTGIWQDTSATVVLWNPVAVFRLPSIIAKLVNRLQWKKTEEV